MSRHDAFEALAGAVMLGEASDAERATFAAHAAACETCRLDAACAPVLVATIDAAKAAETWRPAVDRAVLGRIRASRTSRFRVTIGVLGWAVALSIVLNAAFASGLSSRVFAAFSETGDSASDAGAMRIRLESPPPRIAAVPPVAAHRNVAYVPRRRPHPRHAAAVLAAHAATPVKPAAAADGSADDVPDVLAGIDVDGSGDGAKHVAVQPHPCQTATGDALADVPAPCPAVSAADPPH